MTVIRVLFACLTLREAEKKGNEHYSEQENRRMGQE
jgi:hypothetical protein